MGVDYLHEKLDAESGDLMIGRARHTCIRCGWIWWDNEMATIKPKKLCNLCFNPPHGEGVHRQGDSRG